MIIHGHPITFRLTYTCHCGCGGFMSLTAEQPSLPSSHMWIHLATVSLLPLTMPWLHYERRAMKLRALVHGTNCSVG
jgi:hypothetical protein